MFDKASAARQYLRVGVDTASSGQTLLALYDTAILDAQSAVASIRDQEVEATEKHVRRVNAILTELIRALDHQVAPEFCQGLTRFYLYLQRRLSDAVDQNAPEAAAEVARNLDELRQAWRQAEAQTLSDKSTKP